MSADRVTAAPRRRTSETELARHDRACAVGADDETRAAFARRSVARAHDNAGAAAVRANDVFDPGALERRAGGDCRVEDDRVEVFAGARERWPGERQDDRRSARRDQTHAAQRRRAPADGVEETEPLERADGAAVEIFAAHLAARETRALDDPHVDPGARQKQRRRAARRAAAGDDHVVHNVACAAAGLPSVKVIRKNGSRRTRGCCQPASRASARASAGV